MINGVAILISTIMVMYIVVRAVKLDRMRPWFETRSIYEQEQKREEAARRAANDKTVSGRRSHPFAGASREQPVPGFSRPGVRLKP